MFQGCPRDKTKKTKKERKSSLAEHGNSKNLLNSQLPGFGVNPVGSPVFQVLR